MTRGNLRGAGGRRQDKEWDHRIAAAAAKGPEIDVDYQVEVGPRMTWLGRIPGKAVQPGMAAQLLHVHERWEEEL
jgi:hypothetical protein